MESATPDPIRPQPHPFTSFSRPAQSGLTQQWLDEIGLRPHKAPSAIRSYSKYFSRLKSADDYIVMVDSLDHLLRSILEASHRHIEKLEEAQRLFVRWYCYGERSGGLHEELKTHLATVLEDKRTGLTKAQQWAGLKPLGLMQYMPIEAMNLPIWALREMRHSTTSVGLMFLTPLIPHTALVENPARFLGLHQQPVDFVHYPQTDGRPHVTFSVSQIEYLVERSCLFGYNLLAAADDAEEKKWRLRETQAVENIRQRMAKLLQDGVGSEEAQRVTHQLIASHDYAREVEESFLAFAFGWISAADVTFNNPS
jgi:hypothetical protein